MPKNSFYEFRLVMRMRIFGDIISFLTIEITHVESQLQFADPIHLVPIITQTDSRTEPKYDLLVIQLISTCSVSAALDGGIALYNFGFRAKISGLASLMSVVELNDRYNQN